MEEKLCRLEYTENKQIPEQKSEQLSKCRHINRLLLYHLPLTNSIFILVFFFFCFLFLEGLLVGGLLSLSLSLNLNLFLSLSLYIYIYMHVCVYVRFLNVSFTCTFILTRNFTSLYDYNWLASFLVYVEVKWFPF